MSFLFSSPRPLSPLLTIGLIVTLSACSPQDADNAAPLPAATASEEGSAPAAANLPDDPVELYLHATQQMAKAKSFRLVSTSSNPMGNYTLEFVAPDRYRNLTTDAGQEVEVIMIGKDAYTTVDGKTMRMPTLGENMVAMMNQQMAKNADAARSGKDVTITLDGEETVDGEPAKILRIVTTQPAPSESRSWISTKSGMMLKSETRAELMGKEFTNHFAFSNYNDPSIKIEAPATQ